MRDSKSYAAVPALALLVALAIATPVLGQLPSQSGEVGEAERKEGPGRLDPLPIDGSWQQFTFATGAGVDATPTFDFTGPAIVDITDIQITGDRFEIYDNNVLIGTTSAPSDGDGATGPWSPAACDAAYNGAIQYSRGSFLVFGAGSHTIRVRNLQNPTGFGGGNGCIRANPGQPDLVIDSITHSPANPDTATTITFTATVKNVGNVTAGASTLSFKVGGESPSNPEALFAIPALGPGAVSSPAVRLEILEVAQNYLNTAQADFNDDVAELDEGNNTATDAYTVTQAVEPPPVSYSVLTLPANGTLFDSTGAEIIAAGQAIPDTLLTYTPDAGFVGTDSFTYRCTDNTTGLFSDATVTVVVTEPAGCTDCATLTVNFLGAGDGDVTFSPAGSEPGTGNSILGCNNGASSCVLEYTVGTPVLLQARPVDASDVFSTWGGDCSAGGSSQLFTITMSTDRTCTVTFNAVP